MIFSASLLCRPWCVWLDRFLFALSVANLVRWLKIDCFQIPFRKFQLELCLAFHTSFVAASPCHKKTSDFPTYSSFIHTSVSHREKSRKEIDESSSNLAVAQHPEVCIALPSDRPQLRSEPRLERSALGRHCLTLGVGGGHCYLN